MKAPETLNGYPVILSAPRASDAIHVIVHRKNAAFRHGEFIKATWAPSLGDSWCWGHYCSTLAEAQECVPDAAWTANNTQMAYAQRARAEAIGAPIDSAWEHRNRVSREILRVVGKAYYAREESK